MSLSSPSSLPVHDPQALEHSYRAARQAGEEAGFADAIEQRYAATPNDVLLAAWHYRLQAVTREVKQRVIAWGWALPLALLNALLLWILSDMDRFSVQVRNPFANTYNAEVPLLALLGAPISLALIAVFVAGAGKQRWPRVAAMVAGTAAAALYVMLTYGQLWPPRFQEQYLALAMLHLALLAWIGAGAVMLARLSDASGRFAVLVKSLETAVMGGVLAVAGGIFIAVTVGLFNAINVTLPDGVMRLLAAGGGGLLPVLAAALIYEPQREPQEQPFDEGLHKLIALMLRLLLPLSILVLAIYLAFIPFNWRAAFDNRDVLITYNAMLFAVIALLVGVTPLQDDQPGRQVQTWLRRGVITLSALALLVSLYALAAIISRTISDRFTPNRFIFIGWNVVNVMVLALLLARQLAAGRSRWLPAIHSVFATGITLYLIWALLALMLTPWLFRGNPADAAGLPLTVQTLLAERRDPVLLKCADSPHIYLLQNTNKRWVKDIATFEQQNYRWSDVMILYNCDDVRAIPDGPPIPPDAGPPPLP
ncbi:MAG: hypothetical protein ABTQ73_09950 [Caldilineales bacterium]